jgi:hypothetical protein
VQRIVQHNTEKLRAEAFTEGSDIEKYFCCCRMRHPLRMQFEADAGLGRKARRAA